MILIRLVTLFCLGFSGAALVAKSFDASGVKFELPEGWACTDKNIGWKCIDKNQQPSDSILTVTHKKARPLDTTQAFQRFLSTAKNSRGKDGLPLLSKVERARTLNINDHTWVEGLHYQSEIENYYTHYAITLHGKNAILVSLSTHKNSLKSRTPVWKAILSSLTLSPLKNTGSEKLNIDVPPQPLGQKPKLIGAPVAQKEGLSSRFITMVLVFVGAVAGIIFFIRR